MRIKNLFTIPTEEKVTEKALRRVLISSICSILLCMTCLVGTTWAWFTVSIENEGNVIEIAKVTAEASITPDENTEDPIRNDDGSYLLANGEYTVSVEVDDNAETLDAFGNKHPVYVAIVISDECYYFQFGGSGRKDVHLTVNESSVTLSFGSASWMKPENADPIDTETIVVGEEPIEETTEPPTETTEPSTEATEPSTEATEPSTEATEPSTEATEPSTEATEPSTEATEPSTEATEPSTEATEPSTEATEPSTEATEPSTESTQGNGGTQ